MRLVCSIVIVVSFAIVVHVKDLSKRGGDGQLRPALTDRIEMYVSSSSGGQATEVELRVRGVGLGTSFDQIRRRLGTPRDQRQECISDNTCGAPHSHLSLNYLGVALGLDRLSKATPFKVISVEVISSKWVIQPALRVGMEEAQVRQRLGAPAEESNEGTFRVLHYVNKGNDGFAALYFREGVLKRVAWESAVC
jgi:hypothetical protein